MNRADRFRWVALTVFVLSSAINYLDRQTLATVAPILRAEFRLSSEDYGWVLSVFSIAYAVSAPPAGMMIDRVGLNLGASLAVGLWSCSGIATAFTRGLGGLMGCRTVLGVAEAAGIPAAGKAIHQYLRPAERALGNAINQAGVSAGLILAPPVATWIATAYGWRSAFAFTGLLGLLWVPVWLWTSRRIPANPETDVDAGSRLVAGILRDRRLWAFAAANALNMVAYSLWTNWSMLYLVNGRRLSMQEAASYAWIPQAFGLLGGFAGGWASLRLIRNGASPRPARFHVCLVGAVLALGTAAIPAARTAGWAAAGMSLSMFTVAGVSTNMYALPLDTFGAGRAASGMAALVSSYGAMQMAVSPAFGHLIDLHGYSPVIWIASVTPLAGCAVLWGARAIR